MPSKGPYFNIRQVIELTGVSEFTIRGWENRYNAISPSRTKTGRRQYTQDEVLRIKTLSDLVSLGHRIGHIARLNLAELQKLADALSAGSNQNKDQLLHTQAIAEIFLACAQYDWDQVHRLFLKKRKGLSPQKFILDFLLSFLSEMNRLVEKGQFSIAQEHIVSSMIKENLYSIRTAAPTPHRADIRLVLATPEGDYHETGLLIAATLASLAKIPSLYAGANIPKTELCQVVLRFKATHLVVASTVSREEGSKENFLSFVNFIDRQLPESVALWLGGRHGAGHTLSMRRECESIKSLQDLAIRFKPPKVK